MKSVKFFDDLSLRAVRKKNAGRYSERIFNFSWGMRNVFIKQIIFILLFIFFQNSAYAWTENFDNNLTRIGVDLARHKLIELAPGQGIDGSNAIKIKYIGNEIGSQRIVLRENLENPGLAYSLSFAVKFCENFDFAKGGKLLGLGPLNPVAGGEKTTPLGWSARLEFYKSGQLMTYVYHQNMPRKYGDTKKAGDFRFEPGRYYKIRMNVILNEPATQENGKIYVFVDGNEVIRHEGIKFRSVEGQGGLIQKFLFSTFFGGHSPEWAPKTADGRYKVECAYFDDFSINELKN